MLQGFFITPRWRDGRRRNEIELCARLLGIAAAGLNDNPGLILFTVVTKITMTLMVLPCFAFLFLAYTNGSITPNRARPPIP